MQSIVNSHSNALIISSRIINECVKLNMWFGLVLLFLTLGFSQNSFGATITWDGGGGDLLWTTKTNWDSDEVPKFDDDVIISGGQVKVTDEVYCRSLVLTMSSELQILNTGAIEVEGSLGVGVSVSSSTLTNDGFLNIKDAQGHGLMSTSSSIENSGTITVQNVNISEAANGRGLNLSSGSMTNFSSGDIIVSLVIGDGETQAGIWLAPLTTLTNFGDIEISNTSSSGIESEGEITNSGDIVLNSVSGKGVCSKGILNNILGSRMFLSDIGEEGVENGQLGIMNNFGEIQVTNVTGIALVSFASFSNTGLITLFNGDDNGLDTKFNSTFVNAGEITITQFDRNGIIVSADFINEGKIFIENIQLDGVFNSGTFENKDSLFMNDVRNTGWNNLDSLINTETGYIGFLNSGRLNNETASNIVNDGVIELDSCRFDCIVNEAVFINNNIINIKSSGRKGVYNRDTLLNNDGSSITIDACAGLALQNQRVNAQESLLYNKGFIGIANSGSGILSTDLLVNEETISIHMVQHIGIQNQDSMIILPGAIIEISGITDPSSSGFINFSINANLIVNGQLTISNATNAGIVNEAGSIFCAGIGNIVTDNISGPPLEIYSGAVFTIDGDINIDH